MSVRHALLALLSDGPKCGMQPRDEYVATTGDIWPLNAGQVYTTLQRLDRDGLVGSEGAAADERQRRAAKDPGTAPCPKTPAQGGGPAVSLRAGPHTGDRGVPAQQATPRWARQLFWPQWQQELLAVALIIMTVAAGWLLASH